MKKMRLVLVMVLAMALAVPMAAFAATDLSVKGDITVRTGIGENHDGDYQLQGNWRARLYLDANATSGNIKAYARYRVRSEGFNNLALHGDIGKQQPDADKKYRDFVGSIQDMWLEAKGALIPGLSETTLRVGNWESTRLNDWIGHFGRRNAIQLSGLELGPVTVGFYNGWVTDEASENDKYKLHGKTVSALYGETELDMVSLNAMYVMHNDRPGDKRHNDYAVGVNLAPASGIKLGADYAHSGVDDASAWKVTGELATIPNMKLTASTWKTDADFRPEFRHREKVEHLAMNRYWVDGNDRPGSAWGDPWMESGFSIGAETTQAGLPISVSFKSGKITTRLPEDRLTNGGDTIGGSGDQKVNEASHPQFFTPFAGKDMNVIGVGTTLANVKLNLNVTNIKDLDPVTDLIATHTLKGTPLGGNVSLRGAVRMRKDVDTQFGADATWRAPNGFMLGLHYANYDRGLDWNGNFSPDNLGEGIDFGVPGDAAKFVPGKADGFAITAGYQLNF